jgi:hypothetical protein
MQWGKSILMALYATLVLGLLVGAYFLAIFYLGFWGFWGLSLSIIFVGRVMQRKRESLNGRTNR